MKDLQLTGKRRYRLWKGKLVLQIQRKYTQTYYSGGCVDSDRVTDWVDAELSDLTEHEVKDGKSIL